MADKSGMSIRWIQQYDVEADQSLGDVDLALWLATSVPGEMRPFNERFDDALKFMRQRRAVKVAE